MDNVTFVVLDGLEHAIIDRGNDEFTSMHKSTYDEIEKLIEDHVKDCRKNIPWTDENKVVVDKIVKVFKKTT